MKIPSCPTTDDMIKKYLISLIHAAIADYEKTFLSLLERNPDATLLDLGCDTGEWTIKVAHQVGTKNIIGVDIVKDRLKCAFQKGVKIVEADLNKALPFKNNSFDCIISNQVIEHLYKLDNFVSEIYRILKVGGFAICCTENLSSWHNIGALVLGFQPFSLTNISCKAVIGNPLGLHNQPIESKEMINFETFQHIRVMSWLGLSDIFKVHGFKIEEIRGAGYYPLPPKLARIMANLDKRHSAFLLIKVRKARD